jgi:hypothetical protein
VQILRAQYADFGPTLAMEKLAERHQITLAKETVRRIQMPPACGSRASCVRRRSSSRGCDGRVWASWFTLTGANIAGLRSGRPPPRC